jgi:DNA-binding GntR family transcriptional regulator
MAEKTISLADQAYARIKENILNLTYPPGMTLTEAMLTKELDMSRSPVRTAIHMLQTEGLIVSDYYKSMMVREITDKDIQELYQLRELLEGAAFKEIFTSGRQEEYSYRIEEKVVRMCAASGDLYDWEVADTAMHMEIISIFENERINRIYENNLSELIRIGQYSIKNGMRIPRTNENLKKMVQYMRKNNYEKAFEILKADHFGTGKDSALKGTR